MPTEPAVLVTDPQLFSTQERLELSGPGAAAFAQAQFCNDSRELVPGRQQFGGWLDAKGRVQNFFRLSCLAPDRLHLQLLGGVAAAMAEGLRRFVFRSKVKIEVVTEGGDDIDAAQALAEIRAGIPRLPLLLRGELLAAWLDFERLGAISYKKGCYPGQEIAARMHFRGGNSRHLHRLRIVGLHSPTAALLRDAEEKEAGRVLQAVALDAHSFEALAVLREGFAERILHCQDEVGTSVEVFSAQWTAAP
jgi:folate-binding protein YgfZ